MASSVPDLERMYECGDILANAKGLSYKAVKCPLYCFVEFIQILAAPS